MDRTKKTKQIRNTDRTKKTKQTRNTDRTKKLNRQETRIAPKIRG